MNSSSSEAVQPVSGLEKLLAWLFVGAVLSLTLGFQWVFAGKQVPLGANTLQNTIIVLGIAPYALFHRFYRYWNPVIIAYTLLLVITTVAASRLPGLSQGQSIKAYFGFILPLIIFEIRKGPVLRAYLWKSLPFLALISLGVGMLLQLLGIYDFYQYDWAFRLQGGVVSGQLGMLGIMSVAFALFQARENPRWVWIAILSWGITLWSGTRMALIVASMLGIVYAAEEWQHYRRNPLPEQRRRFALTLMLLTLLFVVYLPFLFVRTFGFLPDLPFDEEYILVERSDEERFLECVRRISERHADVARNENIQEKLQRRCIDVYGTTYANLVTPLPTSTPNPNSARIPITIRSAPQLFELNVFADLRDDEEVEIAREIEIRTSGREVAWRFYWGVAEKNLLFGRGTGAGSNANKGEFKSYEVPHNEYLRLVVDGGFFGLTIILAGYVLLFSKLDYSHPNRKLIWATIAGFAIIAITGNPLTAMQFAIPFWIFMSLTAHPMGKS